MFFLFLYHSLSDGLPLFFLLIYLFIYLSVCVCMSYVEKIFVCIGCISVFFSIGFVICVDILFKNVIQMFKPLNITIKTQLNKINK